MKNNLFLMTIIGLLIVSSGFMSCSKEDNVQKGKLSGSIWEFQESHSSSVGAYEYTYTFKFTSDKAGILTKSGWYQTINAATWTMGPKQNVDDSQNLTYIYAPELQQGVITTTNKSILTKGDHIFSISDNFREMQLGNKTFKLK